MNLPPNSLLSGIRHPLLTVAAVVKSVMAVTAPWAIRAYTNRTFTIEIEARVMPTTNTFDLELTEAEVDRVVGGDTALQHEAVHADRPTNGGTYHPPIAIIAILIGM